MTKRKKKNDSRNGDLFPRVVAYVRVSTEQQASEGSSLETQKAHLELYAQLHNLTIVAYEVDAGLSASSLDRAGLQRALVRMVHESLSGLLVVKLDRLTRSMRDLCFLLETYFEDGGYALMSAGESIDTSTAGGRLILNILTTVSQWEREAAAERTQAVMTHLKSKGEYTGGWPPFGFSVDEEGNLVENAEEQAIVADVRSRRAKGGSIRLVASQVRNPRTGKCFSPTQIARMV